MFKQLRLPASAAILSLFVTVAPLPTALGISDDDSVTFNMVVSAGAKTCLPNANAKVKIDSVGPRGDHGGLRAGPATPH